MLRFYRWLKHVVKRMENNLDWEEISYILGDWIRKKLSGKILPRLVLFIELCLNSFSIIRRTRETGAQSNSKG